jgi:hypothetical protein
MNFDAKARYRFSLVAVTSALLSVGCLTGAPQACAQETGKSFLGFFGTHSNKDDDSIDYSARAPIVVPPDLELPKPKEATHDPAWPKDPDRAAQRRAALDSHTPAAKVTPNGAERDSLPAEGPPDECESNSGTALCLSSTLKGLKSVTNVFHPETVQLAPEPARKYLTDPPSGYRQPAGDGKVTDEQTKDKPDPAAHDRPHMPGTSM